ERRQLPLWERVARVRRGRGGARVERNLAREDRELARERAEGEGGHLRLDAVEAARERLEEHRSPAHPHLDGCAGGHGERRGELLRDRLLRERTGERIRRHGGPGEQHENEGEHPRPRPTPPAGRRIRGRGPCRVASWRVSRARCTGSTGSSPCGITRQAPYQRW